MNDDLSRRLAYVLRHAPESVGLALDEGGWVGLDALVAALRAGGVGVDRAAVVAVVHANDKRRFALSADGARIRASQGHSVAVDLGLTPATPPALLYHGTVNRFLAAILAEGLLPRSRRHVHLSADRATALVVGARRGTPVILEVAAAEMAAAGHLFWRSENDVWLAEAVPAGFLRVVG